MELLRLNEIGWDALRKRAAQPGAFDPSVEATVREVLEAVRTRGDVALDEYSRQFDGVSYEGQPLPLERFDEARAQVTDSFVAACTRAADNIRFYHTKQLQTS